MMKKNIVLFLVAIIVFTSCSQTNDEFKTVEETKYENINGEKTAVSQTVKTIRLNDNQPISILTRISNHTDDSRIKYLTGQTSKDGLKDYLLDSLFYNEKGKDTLKKSFVRLDTIWQPTQLFKKKYNDYDSLSYWETERPFKENHYYRRGIYYSYDSAKRLISKTEFECINRQKCDSILKTVYDYSNNRPEQWRYLYKNDSWTELKSR
jgi:hypothetical protein